MTAVGLCCFSVIAVILTVLMRQLEGRFATLAAAVAGVLLFAWAVKHAAPAALQLVSLAENGAYSGTVNTLFKGFGLALLVSLAAGVARDVGEGGLADKVEYCGKAAILVLAMPLIRELLAFVSSLLA